MKNQPLFGLGRFICLPPLMIVLITGCSKQAENTPTATISGEQSQSHPEESSSSGNPATRAVEAKVLTVQQAVKSHDYDRALDMLLAPTPAAKPPTPEEAAKLNAAMTQLQAQLASAAAAGDAKAIAARERLRQHFLQRP